MDEVGREEAGQSSKEMGGTRGNVCKTEQDAAERAEGRFIVESTLKIWFEIGGKGRGKQRRKKKRKERP